MTALQAALDQNAHIREMLGWTEDGKYLAEQIKDYKSLRAEVAHLQSQLDECRRERAAMPEDAAQCLARRQDYAQRVQDLHTALAASQAELADMTHRFKHYSATMEAERAARNPRNTMSYHDDMIDKHRTPEVITGWKEWDGALEEAGAEVDRLRTRLETAREALEGLLNGGKEFRRDSSSCGLVVWDDHLAKARAAVAALSR